MANSNVSAGQPVTASKANEITIGDTAPTSPSDGYLWVDTAQDPPLPKIRDASASLWRNALQLYTSASEPSSPTTGTFWLDPSTGRFVYYNGRWLLPAQETVYTSTSTFTITQTSPAQQCSASVYLLPGQSYRISFISEITAGGTWHDVILYFARVSGSNGISTLTHGHCWSEGDSFVVVAHRPSLFDATQINVSNLANIGAAGLAERVSVELVITMNTSGTASEWQFRAVHTADATNNPSFTRPSVYVAPVRIAPTTG